MRQDLRQKLILVAKQGETITYGELMREFRVPRGHPKPGIGIGHVIGMISEHEHNNGRPLISAIVVGSNSGTAICPKGTPGGGFFGLLGIPGHLRRPASDHVNARLSKEEQEFVRKEQERIWQYWKTHDDD